MSSFVVVSKVKKFIKDRQGLNTSQSFFEPLNKDIQQALKNAADHAVKMKRKTVMGKDFNFYKERPEVEEALVVASKIKKFIKDEQGLSTSSKVVDQLSYRVEELCLSAIKSAVESKRKTVLDRDFVPLTIHP
jgi:histone H3/H4